MKRLRDILIAIVCIPYLLFFVFWVNWGWTLVYTTDRKNLVSTQVSVSR
jgi:hypothetical protein